MNQNFQNSLSALAEDAYRAGDNKLAVILATVVGCYQYDSLPDLFEAIQLYLGRGAASQILEIVEENARARNVFFSDN